MALVFLLFGVFSISHIPGCKMTQLANYDKNQRPNFGTGKPDNCNFTVVIYKIGPISENSMTMKSDLYVRQTWFDHRLLPFFYNESTLSHESMDDDDFISISQNQHDNIWHPNIYFVDGIQEDTPDEISLSQYTRLFPTGKVLLSRRVILETRCSFDLSFFPMDTQHCYICFESYQFHTKEQTIQWEGQDNSAFLITSETAVFNVRKQVQLITGTSQWPSFALNYSSLCMKVTMDRKLSIYLVTMYVPSMALVVLSWVAFWLDKDATNARGGLAVTTILAQVTLMTGTANRFPQVSHVKLGDIYMMVNFFFVFCTLIEFAVINKQQSQAKNNQKHQHYDRNNPVNSKVTQVMPQSELEKEKEAMAVVPGQAADLNRVQQGDLGDKMTLTSTNTDPVIALTQTKTPIKLWSNFTHDVDDVSKVLFFTTFLIWNFAYFLCGTLIKQA